MTAKRFRSPVSGAKPAVQVSREPVELETYMPHSPEKHPAFLENRVYQGSSGAVYPLPVTSRIAEFSSLRKWHGIWLENKYLRVLILPEIGGRIHVIEDLTNGYDVVYRQTVIKPALVGLAGPWISGGIEFNWPQHHRPATFMPTDTEIEHHDDGSITVWCSDHDPISRMKGMHGVCLHPDNATVHLRVRLRNRTAFVQSFLWWANAATRVHEGYQSFFPPDVNVVADHARRATSTFPLCTGRYYGVDYRDRAMNGVPPEECPANFVPSACCDNTDNTQLNYAPNDLSWYANIPVPTSYMCAGSRYGFFGGYDHKRGAGLVHYADPSISPGKKQWTWGNHEFGYAWDRNLTDTDGPYIELMAGVFTDNQPDFSWLMPGETRSWDQYWYPIQLIGPATFATQHGALNLKCVGNKLTVGICVAAEQAEGTLTITVENSTIWTTTADMLPGTPLIKTIVSESEIDVTTIRVILRSCSGDTLLDYSPADVVPIADVQPATEPLPPEQVNSSDELYLTGLHLLQYRHATRSPEAYWQEAIRRDPDDARSCTAMAQWQLRRGMLEEAEAHLRRAIKRLTLLNANPLDGEPYYLLGLCLRYRADSLAPNDGAASQLLTESLEAFGKAAWNSPWSSPSHFAIAQLMCRNRQWHAAADHLRQALAHDVDNTSAISLLTLVLRRLNRANKAKSLIDRVRSFDLVDRMTWFLNNGVVHSNIAVRLDIAIELADAGMYDWSVIALENCQQEFDREMERDLPTQTLGTEPMLYYTLAWLHDRQGDEQNAATCRQRARTCNSYCCFPSRISDQAILTSAITADPSDSLAHWLIGCLLYNWRRHNEAVHHWQHAIELGDGDARVWRCLGMAHFNVHHDPQQADYAYEQAALAAPNDARICYERDQLWKRIGRSPLVRLKYLEDNIELVSERDDLTVEYCSLLTHAGNPNRAIHLLRERRFQPWEGGEGMVLGQWVRANLALGRSFLADNDPVRAETVLHDALQPPNNLSEARHLLTNASDAWYWYGIALQQLGRQDEAFAMFNKTASFRGDFQEMSVQAFSEMTYYSALALRKLDKLLEADVLLNELYDYGRSLASTPAAIDYFATSLPTMLLFNADIQAAQVIRGQFLQAQALYGLERFNEATSLLQTITEADPAHAGAHDLLAELSDRKDVS